MRIGSWLFILIGAAIGWMLAGWMRRPIGWPVADTGYQAGDGWPAPRYVTSWAGGVCE